METSYDKQKKVMLKMMTEVAKGGSKVAKGIVKRQKAKGDSTVADAACQLFHESIDMYREGSMKFPAMVEDLTKALNAIPMGKQKPDGSDDGENDGAQDYE